MRISNLNLSMGVAVFATALTLSCSGEDGSDGKTPVCDETTGFWEGTTIQCVAEDGNHAVCNQTTKTWVIGTQNTTISCVAHHPVCNNETKTWFVDGVDQEKSCIPEEPAVCDVESGFWEGTTVVCLGKHGETPVCNADKTWHTSEGTTGVSCVGAQGTTPVCDAGTKKWQGTEIACVPTSCDVSEDGAFFVMECGGVEKARWAKAYCGATAYDPDEAICNNGIVTLQLTDTRDSKVYTAVGIGSQIWMAENLNYNVEGSRCFDDVPANCGAYGRFYTWEQAETACPEGWKMPSREDWDALITFAGGTDVAGGKLKAASEGGTDDYGFAGLIVGYYSGTFSYFGDRVLFWSSTDYVSAGFKDVMRLNTTDAASFTNGNSTLSLIPIRCVKE